MSQRHKDAVSSRVHRAVAACRSALGGMEYRQGWTWLSKARFWIRCEQGNGILAGRADGARIARAVAGVGRNDRAATGSGVRDLSGAANREQLAFAVPAAQAAAWAADGRPDFATVMSCFDPTVLIGLSTAAGAFTEPLVRGMASRVRRPIILPLSNPSSRSEAEPADLLAWTDGRALVATGSPFRPVPTPDGPVTIAQCNNAFVFPAMGLAAVAANATRVTDAMFLSAARALATCSPARSLRPPACSHRSPSCRRWPTRWRSPSRCRPSPTGWPRADPSPSWPTGLSESAGILAIENRRERGRAPWRSARGARRSMSWSFPLNGVENRRGVAVGCSAALGGVSHSTYFGDGRKKRRSNAACASAVYRAKRLGQVVRKDIERRCSTILFYGDVDLAPMSTPADARVVCACRATNRPLPALILERGRPRPRPRTAELRPPPPRAKMTTLQGSTT